MSILIIVLIIVVVAIIIVAIAMKSKKKGGPLMTQQPTSEPQAPVAQPTPEEASSNMSDSDTEAQV